MARGGGVGGINRGDQIWSPRSFLSWELYFELTSGGHWGEGGFVSHTPKYGQYCQQKLYSLGQPLPVFCEVQSGATPSLFCEVHSGATPSVFCEVHSGATPSVFCEVHFGATLPVFCEVQCGATRPVFCEVQCGTTLSVFFQVHPFSIREAIDPDRSFLHQVNHKVYESDQCII